MGDMKEKLMRHACSSCRALCLMLSLFTLQAGCRAVRVAAPPAPSEEIRAASGKELIRLRAIIADAVEHCRGIRDYRCIFHKRQRVGGSLQEWQHILFKFRRPMAIYMRWLKGPHEGQEILYAPERYGAKAIVRPGGRLGSLTGTLTPVVTLDVDSYWVMRDNLHPINHAGIGYFLDIFMENSLRARRAGEGRMISRGRDIVFDRPVEVIEAVLPPEKGYYCHRCVMSFDTENSLPIKMQIFDWANQLTEEYIYENLELNIGLGEADFDRGNKEYHF